MRDALNIPGFYLFSVKINESMIWHTFIKQEKNDYFK